MRVLYLSHRTPYPPNKGEKIRAFHQLRALSAAHEVDLFTLADSPEDRGHEASLAPFCRKVTIEPLAPLRGRLLSLRALASRKPLTLPYFYSAALFRKVRQALGSRSYDRVFVYCSSMAQYVEAVTDIPVLLDLVDVDSDKWAQYAGYRKFPVSWIYRREAARLRDYEKRICETFPGVFVTTEREARLIRDIAPSARVHVIPNGVDTEYFRPSGQPAAGAPTVVFTGDMSYFPNAEAAVFFATTVLPLVRESIPGTRFLIVGRNPSPAVLRLKRIPGVEVTGFVKDVRDHLCRAQVSVAPFSIAAGIQNKILEAMSFGLPVVATPKAVQGLSAGTAAAVETGNSAAELADRIVRLLADPEAASRKGLEGRRRVSAEYSWEHALARLLELLDNPFPEHKPSAEAVSPDCVKVV